MKRLSDVVGMRVMSKATAEQAGRVERALVSTHERRIVGFQVGKGLVVDWAALSGVGDDAVVVEAEGRVRRAQGDRELKALRGRYDLVGKRVLSDRGDEIGTVVDVEFDEATGRLEAVETSAGMVAGERVLGLGSYCLVVRREAGTGGDGPATSETS